MRACLALLTGMFLRLRRTCLSPGEQPVRMGEMLVRRRYARDTLAANR